MSPSSFFLLFLPLLLSPPLLLFLHHYNLLFVSFIPFLFSSFCLLLLCTPFLLCLRLFSSSFTSQPLFSPSPPPSYSSLSLPLFFIILHCFPFLTLLFHFSHICQFFILLISSSFYPSLPRLFIFCPTSSSLLFLSNLQLLSIHNCHHRQIYHHHCLLLFLKWSYYSSSSPSLSSFYHSFSFFYPHFFSASLNPLPPPLIFHLLFLLHDLHDLLLLPPIFPSPFEYPSLLLLFHLYLSFIFILLLQFFHLTLPTYPLSLLPFIFAHPPPHSFSSSS